MPLKRAVTEFVKTYKDRYALRTHPATSVPIFIFILLTRISGIPILDDRALAKWGDNPDYQQYRENTPALVLGLRTPEK